MERAFCDSVVPESFPSPVAHRNPSLIPITTPLHDLRTHNGTPADPLVPGLRAGDCHRSIFPRLIPLHIETRPFEQPDWKKKMGGGGDARYTNPQNTPANPFLPDNGSASPLGKIEKRHIPPRCGTHGTSGVQGRRRTQQAPRLRPYKPYTGNSTATASCNADNRQETGRTPVIRTGARKRNRLCTPSLYGTDDRDAETRIFSPNTNDFRSNTLSAKGKILSLYCQ